MKQSFSIRSRYLLAALALAASLLTMLAVLGPARASAAEPGIVQVDGYLWSKVYKVDLRSLQGTPATINGQEVTTYDLLEILDEAEGQQNPAGKDFTVATLSKIEIDFPGNAGSVTYTGSQIRSNSQNLATFYINDQNETVMRVPGKGPGGSVAEFAYDTLNPQLYEPKQDAKDFTVSISPKNKVVKSGTSLTFTASTSGLSGAANASFEWAIDGVKQAGSSATFTHTFNGKSGEDFLITVTASASGYSESNSATRVFIDKAKKKKKKNGGKPKGNGNGGGSNDTSTPYVPGYTDYGSGGGTGGGTGSGSPASGSPDQKKSKKNQQVPDTAGQTVTGQLIDPGSTATVIPPSDSGSGGSTEANPADGSGGGGLPGGAKAAIGIGALLALGGLAEAGAFAGFGRFRFRA